MFTHPHWTYANSHGFRYYLILTLANAQETTRLPMTEQRQLARRAGTPLRRQCSKSGAGGTEYRRERRRHPTTWPEAADKPVRTVTLESQRQPRRRRQRTTERWCPMRKQKRALPQPRQGAAAPKAATRKGGRSVAAGKRNRKAAAAAPVRTAAQATAAPIPEARCR